jgi:hypothetical protein
VVEASAAAAKALEVTPDLLAQEAESVVPPYGVLLRSGHQNGVHFLIGANAMHAFPPPTKPLLLPARVQMARVALRHCFGERCSDGRCYGLDSSAALHLPQ